MTYQTPLFKHGMYCGSNWSDGKTQPSVAGMATATDDFDQTCKEHDRSYYMGEDKYEADQVFFKQNFGAGVIRTIAAVGVLGQNLVRSSDTPINQQQTNKTQPTSFMMPKSTPTMKKTTPQQSAKQFPTSQPKRSTKKAMQAVIAPVSIGYPIRSARATVTKGTKGDVRLKTKVLLSVLKPAIIANTNSPSMYSFVSPVHFSGTELQQLCTSYEKFKFNSMSLHYFPTSATSNSGDVSVVYHKNPNTQAMDPAAGGFYQRMISGADAFLTPVWAACSMKVAVDTNTKNTDNYNNDDLVDFTSGRISVFTNIGSTTQAPGYLLADVDISFSGLKLAIRNVLYGSFLGAGNKQICTFDGPTLALSAGATILGSGFTTGDIYVMTISGIGAVAPAGTNLQNFLKIVSGIGSNNLTLDRGALRLFARAVSATQCLLYHTFDSAIGSDVGDSIQYRTAGTTSGSNFTCFFEQVRNTIQQDY